MRKKAAGPAVREVGGVVSDAGPEAAEAAGFVLAGGQSSRMGQDKALVRLGGQALVWHALNVLRSAGLKAQIAGARSNLGRFAPVIEDETLDRGPLSGICTALLLTSAEWGVFLPVDLPLMSPALIRFLVEHARQSGRAVTVVSVNGFAETFPAVVRRDALAVLDRELRDGRGVCRAAFEAAGRVVIPVEMVVQTGHVADERGLPPYQWFLNVNTGEDLARAEAIAKRAGGHRVS